MRVRLLFQCITALIACSSLLVGCGGGSNAITPQAIATSSSTAPITASPAPATPIPATSAPSTTLAVTAAPVPLDSAGSLALATGTTETLTVRSADAPVSSTSTCPSSVATLSGSPGNPISLAAIAPGNCAVTLTNAAGKTTKIPIVIASTATTLRVTAAPAAIVDGAVTLVNGTPETLTLAAGEGPATAAATCDTGSVATVSGSPGTVFTVTAHVAGTCLLTLSDAVGRSAAIFVVVPPAPVGVTAAPIPIAGGAIAIGPGITDALTIAPGDAPVTASTTCGTFGVATIGGSPGSSLTVSGDIVGTCSITLSNAAGKTTTLQVVVSAVNLPVR